MGKAVEWSLNMMTTGAMKLRELERTAKQNKKGIWYNYVPQVSSRVQHKHRLRLCTALSKSTLQHSKHSIGLSRSCV
jgi:hypothetical protein